MLLAYIIFSFLFISFPAKMRFSHDVSFWNCFMNVQGQHDELEAKFLEERAALEAKYQKLYQPLYTKVSWGFCYWLYR